MVSSDEYLSTVGELNSLMVLEQTGTATVTLVVVAVWARGSQTGLREERGAWLRRLWAAARARLPAAHGMRLLWHTLFFAVPSDDVLSVKGHFEALLEECREPSLESYCVISRAAGTPEEKLALLGEMESGVANDLNFRENATFDFKLLDGRESAAA